MLSRTITVRLTKDLAEWLGATAKRTGLAHGKIVRDQLEKARSGEKQAFMRWAGVIWGPPDLSSRKGFSRR